MNKSLPSKFMSNMRTIECCHPKKDLVSLLRFLLETGGRKRGSEAETKRINDTAKYTLHSHSAKISAHLGAMRLIQNNLGYLA